MTYTAASGGGNWNAPSTWGGSSGYPVAGDTAILNASSGNVTVNVASACDDLTCTGYTGTLTLSANLTLYGNLLFVAGMTLDSGAAAIGIIFAATTSGKTIATGGKVAWQWTFNGSGGEWTLQDDITSGAYYPGTINCQAGTLILNGKTLSCPDGGLTVSSGFTITGGTGSISSGYYTLTISTGAVVTFSTGGISACANLTVDGTLAFSGAGYITTWGGNIALGSGFTGSQVTLTYRGGSTGKTLSSVNAIGQLDIGLSWMWANTGLTLASDLTVTGDVNINTCDSYSVTLAQGSYKLSIGGNFTNNETFDAGTGTVEFFDDSKVSTIGGSVATTFNVLKCQAGGKTVKFKASQTVTVTTFDFDGGSGDPIVLDTDTGSGTWTLSTSSGTVSVTYCDIHRSTATGGATFEAFTSNGNVDGGGNTGWSFSSGALEGDFFF